jgi:hypothetical protein
MSRALSYAEVRLLPVARAWWLFVLGGPLVALWVIACFYAESRRGPYGPSLRPTFIATSAAEEIFVYDMPHIRVFDRDGRFLHEWEVPSQHGTALLAFDSAGVLHVATARDGMHHRYDTRGVLLSRDHDPGAWDRLEPESRWYARAPSGSVYAIRNRAIVRLPPKGPPEVVVPGPPPGLASRPYNVIPLCVLLPLFGIQLRTVQHRWRQNAAA